MVATFREVFEEAVPVFAEQVENASLDVADWSTRVGDQCAEGEEGRFWRGFFCVWLFSGHVNQEAVRCRLLIW